MSKSKRELVAKLDVFIKSVDRFNDERMCDRLADFILADRKRLVEPLVKHKEWMAIATTSPFTALHKAEEAINQVLEQIGGEE